MNENRLNVLLTEYTACLNDVSQLDSDIWQSSYVFLGISIAGYTILIQFQVNNWYELGVSCVVAILGVSLVIVWDKLCYEWLRIIKINLHIKHFDGFIILICKLIISIDIKFNF